MGRNKYHPPQTQVTQIVKHETTASSTFIGPLPPPEVLLQYENASPGAADRILTMSEKQSEHRQYLEKTVILSQEKCSAIGQKFALIIAILCIVACCFCAYVGQPAPASVIGGATIIGSITAFLKGKQKREQDLQQHSKNK